MWWPAARAWQSRPGQDPGSVLAREAQGEESAQVECCDAVAEPVVVLLDTAVRNAAGIAGEPRDRTFDHRAVLSVGGLEGFVTGSLAVLALQLVVLAE